MQFINRETGQAGTGVTIDVSRCDVRMLARAGGCRIGDSLHFLLAFAGTSATRGGVAICSGRVTHVGAAVRDGQRMVAMTIDRQVLRPADRVTVGFGRALSRAET